MISLYRSTGGDSWRDRTGWLGKAGTECSWRGVVCDSAGTGVTELHLASNGLAGGIPPELAGLTRLRVLDLRSNALFASIPSELGQLASLEILDLAYNGLSGEIPRGLGRLARLRVLSLEENELSAVSPGLGRLASLTFLDLSGNPIAALPDDLARLSRLRTLRLIGGRLPEIPPAVLSLPSLETLDLSGNPMPGSGIPDAIGDLASLVRFACAGCGLDGPLPPAITGLTRLQELDLRGNSLTALPELADLTALAVLHLSGNRFGGPMPDLAELTNLTALDLSGNPFTPGPVPDSYRGLRRLRELQLRDTGRTGEIPVWLPDLDRLTWLDLAGNGFDPGPMPAFLETMGRLRRLWLGGTGRTGLIPDWIWGSSLTLLSLRDNAFDPGPIPPEALSARIGYLDLSGTERTGGLPLELAANRSLRALLLDRNHLEGPIPVEWGSFPALEALSLAANALSGPVPRALLDLSALRDGGLDLRWNALSTADPEVGAWLDRKAGDWRSTQTLAPRNLAAAAAGSDRIRLSWTPARNRAGGGYEILHALSREGPYLIVMSVAGKLTTGATVGSLAPRMRHWFRVRSVTDPNPDNPNLVTSLPGPPTSAVTFPESL